MKGKKYIQKIKIIATADIANGNKEKLLIVMKKLIKQEKYEDCEGIKQALEGGDK